MTEFTAPSGTEVVINAASWKDAKALKNAIERELAVVGDINLSSILLIDSSPIVDAALWPCLVRCLYNKQKITENTFDKPEARQDYYDIVIACAKENLTPLANSLFSKLSEFGIIRKQASADQKLA